MGKDQLFFPIKEVAPRTLRPHTVFCVRAFLCALASVHIDPKAKIERGIPLIALASEASLGTLIPKRE